MEKNKSLQLSSAITRSSGSSNTLDTLKRGSKANFNLSLKKQQKIVRRLRDAERKVILKLKVSSRAPYVGSMDTVM